MFKFFSYLLLTTLLWGVSACSVEKLGNNLGKGFAGGVSTKTDTLGRTVVAGLREELASETTKVKLANFIDSVVSPLTARLEATTAHVRDSIINHQTLVWADSLTEAFTGVRLSNNMSIVQARLIGKTKQQVIEMRDAFRELLSEILSDTTRTKVSSLRDELLGPKTNAAITRIVDTAVIHLVDSSLARLSARYKKDFSPDIDQKLTFIHRNAIIFLVVLGAIAAIIIFLIWQNRKKYLRMVTLLTKQINEIPQKEVYDQVTRNIKSEAISTGLEPDLRDILKKNGMLASQQAK